MDSLPITVSIFISKNVNPIIIKKIPAIPFTLSADKEHDAVAPFSPNWPPPPKSKFWYWLPKTPIFHFLPYWLHYWPSISCVSSAQTNFIAFLSSGHRIDTKPTQCTKVFTSHHKYTKIIIIGEKSVWAIRAIHRPSFRLGTTWAAFLSDVYEPTCL